jgi:hypothetical protein
MLYFRTDMCTMPNRDSGRAARAGQLLGINSRRTRHDRSSKVGELGSAGIVAEVESLREEFAPVATFLCGGRVGVSAAPGN